MMMVVRCLAAVLAGARSGEAFEDEGVGHCCRGCEVVRCVW